MNLLETMQNRRSIRSFESRLISESHVEQIASSLGETGIGPFGNEVRFALLHPSKECPEALKGLGGALGTYGFIKHVQAFAVGALKTGPLALCDVGYLLERAVLTASSLGVGSCWLGGSFRPGPFGKVISVRENETIPAVIALGYPGARRRVTDKLIEMHHSAGNQRAEWATRFFDENDFERPADIETLGMDRDLFSAVHVAPSSCNTQPWRIVRSGAGVFHLFFARDQRYSKKDRFIGNADLQLIDMGIAMCHFEEMARALNRAGKWEVLDAVDTLNVPDHVKYLVSWLGEPVRASEGGRA